MKKMITAITFLVLCVMFASCSTESNFSAKTFSISAAKINELDISVRDRKITVSPSTGNEITISYFESEKEYYLIENKNGVLSLDYVQNKAWYEFFGTKPANSVRTIDIRLPQTVIDNLSISTTNEEIVLDDTSIGNSIKVENNNGSIKVNNINAGSSITLINKDADISGSILGGYDAFNIDVKIKKGDSNLPNKDNGTKQLNLTNNNGDINLNLIK